MKKIALLFTSILASSAFAISPMTQELKTDVAHAQAAHQRVKEDVAQLKADKNAGDKTALASDKQQLKEDRQVAKQAHETVRADRAAVRAERQARHEAHKGK